MRAPLATLAVALTLLVSCTSDTPAPSPTPATIQPATTASSTPTPGPATPSPTPTATRVPAATPIPVIQELPDRFTIQLLDFETASVDIRRRLGSLTATVDGVECTTVDLDVLEPPLIVIGTSDQPDDCRTEGAWVTLYAGGEGERVEHFRLHLGAIAQLGNYGPMPAVDGPGTSPTPWTGVFEFNGVLVAGFEVYAFHPGTCPISLDPYWVSPPNIEFNQRVIEQSGSPELDPFGLFMFRIQFNGELSAFGTYGHEGVYNREVIPHDLISAELADDCDWGADGSYRFYRSTWHQAAITSYRFTFERHCECQSDWLGPTEVTVEDGVITAATVDGHPAPEGAALTITDLFDEIQKSLAHPVSTLITYHPTLGYPLAVQLDLEAIAVDGGLSLTILALEPLD